MPQIPVCISFPSDIASSSNQTEIGWNARSRTLTFLIEPTELAISLQEDPSIALPQTLIQKIQEIAKATEPTLKGIAAQCLPHNTRTGLSRAQRQKILNYIDQNLDQDLSLKKLAGCLQLSSHYFAHLFKQSMRISPHQYVITQRVEWAKRLLVQADISIAEIAYQVGFSNQAHLNRHFKRCVGITPGQFRRSTQASQVQMNQVVA